MTLLNKNPYMKPLNRITEISKDVLKAKMDVIKKQEKELKDKEAALKKEPIDELTLGGPSGDAMLRDLHFEIDPAKQKKMKIKLGREKYGAYSDRSALEDADYALKKFRQQMQGYTGDPIGVYDPSKDTYKAKAKAPKVRWTQKKYDRWIDDVSSNEGWRNAYDMAQNANNEPGLIDWVKKNVVFNDETPLERIQYDIEAMAESVNEATVISEIRWTTSNVPDVEKAALFSAPYPKGDGDAIAPIEKVKKRWETILSKKLGGPVDLSRVKEIMGKYGLRIVFEYDGRVYRLKSTQEGPRSARYALQLLKQGSKVESVNEANFNQLAYISSAEYQKVKKLKNFNAADWKWDGNKGLYVNLKVKSSVNEGVDYLYDPHRLIDAALRMKWISEEEARQPETVRAAKEHQAEDAEDWDEDEGFGSSDFSFSLMYFMERLGYEMDVKNGKIVKVEESVNEATDPYKSIIDKWTPPNLLDFAKELRSMDDATRKGFEEHVAEMADVTRDSEWMGMIKAIEAIKRKYNMKESKKPRARVIDKNTGEVIKDNLPKALALKYATKKKGWAIENIDESTEEMNEESDLPKGPSKAGVKRLIKDVEEMLDTEIDANGDPLTNETEMILQKELKRLKALLRESVNEGIDGLKAGDKVQNQYDGVIATIKSIDGNSVTVVYDDMKSLRNEFGPEAKEFYNQSEKLPMAKFKKAWDRKEYISYGSIKKLGPWANLDEASLPKKGSMVKLQL